MVMNRIEELHDRVTRGISSMEELTVEERTLLESWYTELERQEAQVLFGNGEPPGSISDEAEKLVLLQQQIERLLAELANTTARLQEVTKQNEVLRNEIGLLRTQVATKVGLATT